MGAGGLDSDESQEADGPFKRLGGGEAPIDEKLWVGLSNGLPLLLYGQLARTP